ncbi:MAG: hypothetical protein R2749_17350 [Acidimicrobiales bacterium]
MHRAARWLTTSAAAVVAVALGSMTPADAAVIDTDPLYLNTANADFGGANHSLGAPVGSGTVAWGTNSTSNPWARVSGNLWLDEPVFGGCAVARILFLDAAGNRVDGDITQVCRYGPSFGPTTAMINESSRDTRVVKVRVCVEFVDAWGGISPRTCVARIR